MDVSKFFFFQAEDGIRDLVRSRGLGDVYKRQGENITEVSLVISGDGFETITLDLYIVEGVATITLSLIHI